MNTIKNLAATALVAVALISPALSLASTTPVPTNGNPYEVTNAWGLTGTESMRYWVAPGTLLVIPGGIVTSCPKFITTGCYDLRDYYASHGYYSPVGVGIGIGPVGL